MKYKITRRLVFYFTIVLILFSIIMSILFMILFTRHTTRLHKEDLLKRADIIASTLSELSQGYNTSSEHGHGSGYENVYDSYINFLDDIAMSEVWLVDSNKDFIQVGHGHGCGYAEEHLISYEELPEDADHLIQQIFEGEIVYSEKFSAFLGTPSVTVGAPVYNYEGDIVAAVLLHTSVHGTERTILDGFSMLGISLVAALILAVGLSIVLSMRFIKPLKTMETTASNLICGDYTVQTGIVQKDEIGSLAQKMDILANRLDIASKESEKLEKLRQDFISNISHELRTPVTVIRGSLEALNDEVITEKEEVKEYYQQMLGDTIHLQRLVNDLLELSRLQNTDFVIEMTQVNLIDTLDDAIRSIRLLAKDKKVEIVLKKECSLFEFFGDYGRIRQMFMIVLDNAVKFSPSELPIEVNVTREKNRCNVVIRDYGCGIAKENLPYIFERFYHVKSEKNQSGTGLGLAIAKQIANRHNITLSCESEEGKFTQFFFAFEYTQTENLDNLS